MTDLNSKAKVVSTRRPFLVAKVCMVASLGGVLFGFDTAVISGTVGMVEAQFELDKIEVGWFGSSALIGAIIGSLVSGSLGDKYGRRSILIVSAVLFFFSALGSTLPSSFSLLIAARLVGGLGIGIASVLAPLYISEFSPAKIRGRLVALYQMSIVIGILLAYFSNWGVLNHAHANPNGFGGSGTMYKIMVSEVWRAMFGTEMVPALLFFLLLWTIPESPRWLVKEGYIERSTRILERINGKLLANAELKNILDALSNKGGSLKELLKPGFKKALIAGLGLSVFGQFTGVNIIVYYGPDILRDAGLNFDGALKFQVAIGLINLVFTALALWKIDRWGRRPLLIWGMLSVCISLIVIGMLFSIPSIPSIWIVVMLCVYMASLAFSINAVIWVLLGELYPTRIRGRAMSVVTFANWGANFGTAFLFPWFVSVIGMNAGFFVFAGFCLMATVFFHKMIPETKGKTLEEIEEYWRNKGLQEVETMD
ncbi:sugar porter family MFS transporter [Muricauda sp. TY007]|uniref:sugar porter family MFS transporter n=1 Tax=Allomuricauda sp. TY007 TaxID=2683200 RepID=UPI0013BFBA59|nr:sugar porter family MFS transporter [Muricauda sp. TY007]NDV16562.1 sugar porter family MFS transporter [Muricauda sp. TY007]